MSALKRFRNAINGVLTIKDGSTPAPLDVIVATSVGDFNLSGPLKNKLHETVNVFARNRLIGTAPGARIVPTLTFTAQVDALSHANNAHVVDMILGLEKFAGRKSTVADDWTVHFDVSWTVGDDEIVCHDVEILVDSLAESTEVNTVSFTGTVRGKITINGVDLDEIEDPAAA